MKILRTGARLLGASSGTEVLRSIGILLLLALGGGAFGEDWTVQTAAFQDNRQAASQIQELRALGFDAYGEFVMNDGNQYSRVRVGCYRSQDGASYLARDLHGYVTAAAVPQPKTDGSGGLACFRIDPGFVKPEDWSLLRVGNDIAFRVEVGGLAAYLHHDGNGWFLNPELQPEPAAPPTPGAFRQGTVAGVETVVARLADGSEVNACGGSLLWQSGYVAVVERSSTVIACIIDEDETARRQ